MWTGDISGTAKPSKAMVTGEENKSFKSSKPAVSTLGKTAAPSQPSWSTYLQMQAYCSAGPAPPPFFASSVSSSATPSPYVWGTEHPLMQAYATPPQYPVLYHHGGISFYPNLVAAQGLALAISEAEGKALYGEEWDSKRACKGILENVEFVSSRSGENRKPVLDSGNNDASRSGGGSSSDETDEKANQNEFSGMKKRSYDKMLANESSGQNNSTSHRCGANHQVSDMGPLLVSMPASKLNMGTDSNVSPAGSKSMNVRPDERDVSQPGPSAMMVGHKEILSEQRIQDESELKKQRKRLSNKESARKSRDLKQKTYVKLEAKVAALSQETSLLSYDLKRHSEYCAKLKRENNSLMKELRQTCGPDVISILEAKDPDRVLQSVGGKSNSSSPELPSKYSSPVQNIDTSNSNGEVEAGCD